MTPRHPPIEFTRRHALSLTGGFSVAPFTTAFGAAAEPITPIMTRPIPHTGERLPIVGLGTASQWPGDAPALHAALSEVVRTLAAGGGSVIDTAATDWGYGDSEAMLGEVMTENSLQSRIFIATKIEQLLSRSEAGLQLSLKRSGRGKIDLMQLHNVVQSGQDFAPLRDWKARGLIRYWGVTTSEDFQFGTIEEVMRRSKPDFVQFNYSLHNREAEKRLLPTARDLGVATLINLPFGGKPGKTSRDGNLIRLMQGKPLPPWASEFDASTWAQFFLKYLLGDTAVTAVIPGTSNPLHVADNLGAGRGRLPDAAQRQQMVRFVESAA
jgi:aryl-alcohol dehydrogenase-like predicted oxidoreductase